MQLKCPYCHGTGQIAYFKGISRFLLSQADCPECGGMGFVLRPDRVGEDDPAQSGGRGAQDGDRRDVAEGWEVPEESGGGASDEPKTDSERSGEDDLGR